MTAAVSTQNAYRPLPRPPTAFNFTVRKLIARVQEGAVRVPSFQRPLRWKQADVVKLFDSILKGYPIGSLLFWKQAFEAASVTLGSAIIEGSATQDGWFVVDGQQRVTALAASLLGLHQASDRRWDVGYDLATQEVSAGASGPRLSDTQVPMSVIGAITRLGQWLRSSTLDEQQVRQLEDIQQRVLDYEIPCYLMDTNDEGALRGVFSRLNSSGVRMQQYEVFDALFGGVASASRTRTFDLLSIQEQVNIDGFGLLPKAELRKAVLAMSGKDHTQSSLPRADELVSEDEARDALVRTIHFFQASFDQPDEPGAGIPAFAFIPYPAVFSIAAKWFFFFPESGSTVLRRLANWVWRGVLSGVHQRAQVSALRRQEREIVRDDELGSLERLLRSVEESFSREWEFGAFDSSNAKSRVEILTLLSLGPLAPVVDSDENEKVDWRELISDGERVAREIFAPSDFPQTANRDLARTAANRIVLSTKHTGLAASLREWIWEKNHQALESHLIDEAGFQTLQKEPISVDEMTRFLERRASRLRSAVDAFLQKRGAAGEAQVYPLERYLDVGHGG
jgi:hypothetical protein